MSRPNLNLIAKGLYKIFKQENWEWYRKGTMKVPSIEEIERALYDLEGTARFEGSSAELGRLKVTYDEDEGFRYYLDLKGFDDEK